MITGTRTATDITRRMDTRRAEAPPRRGAAWWASEGRSRSLPRHRDRPSGTGGRCHGEMAGRSWPDAGHLPTAPDDLDAPRHLDGIQQLGNFPSRPARVLTRLSQRFLVTVVDDDGADKRRQPERPRHEGHRRHPNREQHRAGGEKQ